LNKVENFLLQRVDPVIVHIDDFTGRLFDFNVNRKDFLGSIVRVFVIVADNLISEKTGNNTKTYTYSGNNRLIRRSLFKISEKSADNV